MESLVALLPMGVFLAFAGAMAWYSKAQHEALERGPSAVCATVSFAAS